MGAIKNKAMEIAIKQAIQKIKEDPDKNLPKLLEIVEKVDKDNMWEQQYKFIEKVVKDPSNNWNHYIRNILEDIDEEILEKFLCNFIINSAIKGISRNHEIKEKEGCGAPWAIVMDPTTACNMKCTGCWAADYGKSLNLGFDLMDKIVTEGKDFGCYWYLFTGGEPLVKKDEIIKLCKKHKDCIFIAFTNATLIDEEFVKQVEEVGNLSFSISVEGTEETTDQRRGKGAYQKVMKAMDFDKVKEMLSIDTFYSPRIKEEEVFVRFPNYTKYISREFLSKDEMFFDRDVSSMKCNVCDKPLKVLIDWFSDSGKMYYCLGECQEHGYVRGKIKVKPREEDSFFVVKIMRSTDEEGAESIREKQESIREKRRERRQKSLDSEIVIEEIWDEDEIKSELDDK